MSNDITLKDGCGKFVDFTKEAIKETLEGKTCLVESADDRVWIANRGNGENPFYEGFELFEEGDSSSVWYGKTETEKAIDDFMNKVWGFND